MAWSFSSEHTGTTNGAPSDEGEASGRSLHLHAIASHPQREQRVTESSGSEKVRARVEVGGAASSS